MLLREAEVLDVKARLQTGTALGLLLKTWLFQGTNSMEGPVWEGGREEGRKAAAFDCGLICLY